MKFFYILNKNNKLIEFGKTSSERFIILESIIGNISSNSLLHLKSIFIEIGNVEKEINNLLRERNSNVIDAPDYKDRFLENEIFETKQFKEDELKLCNTGFDNKIIFLINIYNSLLKDEKPYFLIFSNNHMEFNNWLSNNTDIQTDLKLDNIKNFTFVFFDGLTMHKVTNQYDNWLSSSDFSIWSDSYVEIENKRIYIIKENVKVLSTFRYFNKEELELIAKKYDLKIKEENGVYYAYTDNYDSRQLEISENDELIVVYSIEGSRIPESIYIYGVFEKKTSDS